MKKVGIIVLAVFTLCLFLASTTVTAEEPQYGGRIVIRAADDPMTLNPFMLGGQAYAWDISYALNGYLFVIGPDGEFQPDVAESWETPDNTTLIFNIREGMKFHDGVELTADDVVFTFEKNLDPDFASYWHTGIRDHIESVEKIDDYTVQVNMYEPFAPIFYSLLFPIVPEHAWEEKGEDFAYEPVGAGPFKFKEWRPDDRFVLEAFDDFYAGRPYLDELEFRNMDYDTALMAFLNEEIDVLSVGTEDLDMVEEHDNLHIVNAPGTSWFYLGVNQTEGPLADKRVRQAISYAINREEIIENIYHGAVQRATGPIVPVSWGHNPDVKTYPYNPGQAVRLLREAGYEDGVTIELKCSSGAVSTMEIIQSQLALVGIEIEMVPMEWGLLTEDINNDDFELHYRAWTRQTDPERGINRQFMCDTNTNIAGFCNPRVDELAEKAVRTLDIEERREYYYEIQEILAEELPAIFLWYGFTRSAHHDRVKNFSIDPYYSYRTYMHMWLEN